MQQEQKERRLSIKAEEFEDFWNGIDADGEPSLLVTGYSMQPFLLHSLSVVFLVKQERYEPKKGDIVLFRRDNGKMVLHRVAKTLPDGSFLSNGDAQNWTECVRTDQIRALVVRICRRKRIFSVNNVGYRFLVRLWMSLRPLRPYIFAFLGRLRRIKAKLFLGRIK